MNGAQLYNVFRQTGSDIGEAFVKPVEARIRAQEIMEARRLRGKQEARSDVEWQQRGEDREESRRLRQKAEGESDQANAARERIAKSYEERGDTKTADRIRMGDNSVMSEEFRMKIAGMKAAGKKPDVAGTLDLADATAQQIMAKAGASFSKYTDAVQSGDEAGAEAAMGEIVGLQDAARQALNEVTTLNNKIGGENTKALMAQWQEIIKDLDPDTIELQASTVFNGLVKSGTISKEDAVEMQNTYKQLGYNMDLSGIITPLSFKNAMFMAARNPDLTKRVDLDRIDMISEANTEEDLMLLVEKHKGKGSEAWGKPEQLLVNAKISMLKNMSLFDEKAYNQFIRTDPNKQKKVVGAAKGTPIADRLSQASKKAQMRWEKPMKNPNKSQRSGERVIKNRMTGR